MFSGKTEISPSQLDKFLISIWVKYVTECFKWTGHLCLKTDYPPASEASRGVYWDQTQKNFTHPYTEYP